MPSENHEIQIGEKSSTRNQYFAAAVCTLLCFCGGCFNGWTSYSIPLLLDKNQTILTEPITSYEASLVGSLPNLGAFLSLPFSGWMCDRFGRKRGAQIFAVPIMICFAMTCFAPSANYIILGRFIAGLGIGGSTSLAPLYTGETAEVSIRGALGTFLSVGFTGGLFFSFILGSFAGYFTVLCIFMGMLSVFSILMSFMPETPVFLVKNGKEEEAAKSLAWLRGIHVNSQIVRDEIPYLRKQIYGNDELLHIQPRMENFNGTTNSNDELKMLEATKVSFSSIESQDHNISRPAWKQLVMDKASRNGFLMAIMLLTFHVTSGLYPMQTYTSEIMKASGIKIASNVCSIFYAMSLVTGTLICAFLADRAGRKVLMVASLGAITMLFIIAGFTMQTGYGPSYIPAAAIVSCAIVFNCGAGCIPFVSIGEYFDNDVRDLASSILVQYVYLIAFLVIHFFRAGVEILGFHVMFYISAAICFTGSVMCLVFQPETSGLKQEEILAIFGRENKENNKYNTT